MAATSLSVSFVGSSSAMASLSSPSRSSSSSSSSPSLSLRPRLLAVGPLRLRFVARSGPSAGVETKGGDNLDKQLQQGISIAQEVCAGNEGSEECAVAWDEVEELSAAKAHKRVREKKSSDPLEKFCDENPSTDECRVYED